MLSSVRFSSVTKIVLKNWPPKWGFDKKVEQNAVDKFNTFVSDYLDNLEKQHSADPDYKVSALTLRTSNTQRYVMPKILVIDNEGSPDRDTFIKDEHNEKERILFLAVKKLLDNPDTAVYDYDEFLDDTTTPSPKSFDWNLANLKIDSYNLKELLALAHTKTIRRYADKATSTIEVDGGLPAE